MKEFVFQYFEDGKLKITYIKARTRYEAEQKMKGDKK